MVTLANALVVDWVVTMATRTAVDIALDLFPGHFILRTTAYWNEEYRIRRKLSCLMSVG